MSVAVFLSSLRAFPSVDVSLSAFKTDPEALDRASAKPPSSKRFSLIAAAISGPASAPKYFTALFMASPSVEAFLILSVRSRHPCPRSRTPPLVMLVIAWPRPDRAFSVLTPSFSHLPNSPKVSSREKPSNLNFVPYVTAFSASPSMEVPVDLDATNNASNASV